ncbi:MAG: hypothetical protein KDD76_02890, partial [Rickettsiales bacterium]|nr:hypothetical protein [Rickettsiales bacterium]
TAGAVGLHLQFSDSLDDHQEGHAFLVPFGEVCAVIGVFETVLWEDAVTRLVPSLVVDGDRVNLPTILATQAAGDEFTRWVQRQPELVRARLREAVCQTVLQFGDLSLRHRSGELLRKLQQYIVLPLTGTAETQKNQPFSIQISRCIPLGHEGVFVSGWIRDPFSQIDELVAITDLGYRISLKQRFFRTARRDVAEYFADSIYGDFKEGLGFVAYGLLPKEVQTHLEGMASLHGFRFQAKLRNGIVIHAAPVPKFWPRKDAERLLLEYTLDKNDIAQAALTQCVYPALYRLKRQIEPVEAEERLTFSEERIDPAVTIIVACTSGQEAMLAALFARMAGDVTLRSCRILLAGYGLKDSRAFYQSVRTLVQLYAVPCTLLLYPILQDRYQAYGSAIEEADSPYFLLMDAGVQPHEDGWVRQLLHASQKHATTAGILAPKLLRFDGTINAAGTYFEYNDALHSWNLVSYGAGYTDALLHPLRDSEKLSQVPRSVPALSGECLFISRERYHEVRGFSHLYADGDYVAADISLKCRKLGYQNYYIPGLAMTYLAPSQNQPTEQHFVAEGYDRWLFDTRWSKTLRALAMEEAA